MVISAILILYNNTSYSCSDSIDVKISSREAHNQYNMTKLHTFITDTFPGATLLEEHQVWLASMQAIIDNSYYSASRF